MRSVCARTARCWAFTMQLISDERLCDRRFEARIGDRTIVTQVKKKAEAQVEYDTATNQGHTAVLVKQEPGK